MVITLRSLTMATERRKRTTHQSIAILDLKTNKIVEYPDARLSDESHQSYFIGLAFSSNGKHLYASVGSLTDPTGAKTGNTGNGIAVYTFSEGKVTPERFIPIALQPLSTGKKLAVGLKAPPHMAIPYPAGLTVITDSGHDKLLIANNLSDNVVLLDPATGKVLRAFDLSTSDLVPSSFPYTCVAARDGRRAWCSLWNGSQVVELNLARGGCCATGQAADDGSIGGSPGSWFPSYNSAAESGRESALHCALQF